MNGMERICLFVSLATICQISKIYKSDIWKWNQCWITSKIKTDKYLEIQ